MALFGVAAGSVAAVCFQLIYVPIANDWRHTVTFFWGVFFLLFEVPAGAIVGALVGLLVAGINALLPRKTTTINRTLAAGFVSAITLAAVISVAELLVPESSSFDLSFYASVVIGCGTIFGIFTWGYFRRLE